MGTPTTGGAERGLMVLEHYTKDPDQRLANLLTDLAEWADDEGLDFEAVATVAFVRARTRRHRRPDPATKTDTDRRYDVVFGRMPYGGIANFRYPKDWPTPAEHWTPELVAGNLETLADTLERVAEDDRKRDAELADHKAAVNGFGRLVELATAGR